MFRPVIRSPVQGCTSEHILCKKHGFVEGCRIILEGFSELPHLERASLHVSKEVENNGRVTLRRDRFCVKADLAATIVSVDAENSCITTAGPHGLSWGEVEIHVHGTVNVHRFEILEGQGAILKLGIPDSRGRFPFQLPTPADLGHVQESLVGAELRAFGQKLDLSLCAAPANGAVVVSSPIPRSYTECTADWTNALSAVAQHGVRPKKWLRKQVPETAYLEVRGAGFACDGVYVRSGTGSGEVVYSCGPLWIQSIDHLGLWGLFANVRPCVKLAMDRAQLGLQKYWEGPQLLYVCSEDSPLGSWEVVLGHYPVPAVSDHMKEKEHRKEDSWGVTGTNFAMFPGLPRNDTQVRILAMLFDPKRALTTVCRRDGPKRAVPLIQLLIQQRRCMSVSKSWREGLAALWDLRESKNEFLQVPNSVVSFVDALRLTCCRFQLDHALDGVLAIVARPEFLSADWGARIERVYLQGSAPRENLRRISPHIKSIAQRLLHDVSLSWLTQVSAEDFGPRILENLNHVEFLGPRFEDFVDSAPHIVISKAADGGHGVPVTVKRRGYLFRQPNLETLLDSIRNDFRIQHLQTTSQWIAKLETMTSLQSRYWNASLHLCIQLQMELTPLTGEMNLPDIGTVSLVFDCLLLPFTFCSYALDQQESSCLVNFVRWLDPSGAFGRTEIDARDDGGHGMYAQKPPELGTIRRTFTKALQVHALHDLQ